MVFEIIISIIVALCYGISTALQKYSLNQMKKFSIRKMLSNWKWLGALSVGAIGLLLYVYALSFVALSTIQPILALTIAIPILAGFLFFNERPNKIEILSILLIIVGVIWVSI